MFERACGLCALSLALGALTLQGQDLFVLPSAGGGGGVVAPFAASRLSPLPTFTAGNGSFLVLPTPPASNFYVVADSTTQTVASTDSTFLHPTALANLSSPATAAVLTPDGQILAVADTENSVRISTSRRVSAGCVTRRPAIRPVSGSNAPVCQLPAPHAPGTVNVPLMTPVRKLQPSWRALCGSVAEDGSDYGA